MTAPYYRIDDPEHPPVFPCWLWAPRLSKWHKYYVARPEPAPGGCYLQDVFYSHHSPDAPTPPRVVPDDSQGGDETMLRQQSAHAEKTPAPERSEPSSGPQPWAKAFTDLERIAQEDYEQIAAERDREKQRADAAEAQLAAAKRDSDRQRKALQRIADYDVPDAYEMLRIAREADARLNG